MYQQHTSTTRDGPSELPPQPLNLEMAGSTAFHPELSGESTPGVPELSPDPERDAINTPKRVSVSSWTDTNTNAGTACPAEESGMRPNLDLESDRSGIGSRDTHGSNLRHVMSWMDYDGNMQGPVR